MKSMIKVFLAFCLFYQILAEPFLFFDKIKRLKKYIEKDYDKHYCSPIIKTVVTPSVVQVPEYHTIYKTHTIYTTEYKNIEKTVEYVQTTTVRLPEYLTTIHYEEATTTRPFYATVTQTVQQPVYKDKIVYVPSYETEYKYSTLYNTKTDYETVYTTVYRPRLLTKTELSTYQKTITHTEYSQRYVTITKTQQVYITDCEYEPNSITYSFFELDPNTPPIDFRHKTGNNHYQNEAPLFHNNENLGHNNPTSFYNNEIPERNNPSGFSRNNRFLEIKKAVLLPGFPYRESEYNELKNNRNLKTTPKVNVYKAPEVLSFQPSQEIPLVNDHVSDDAYIAPQPPSFNSPGKIEPFNDNNNIVNGHPSYGYLSPPPVYISPDPEDQLPYLLPNPYQDSYNIIRRKKSPKHFYNSTLFLKTEDVIPNQQLIKSTTKPDFNSTLSPKPEDIIPNPYYENSRNKSSVERAPINLSYTLRDLYTIDTPVIRKRVDTTHT